MSARADASSGGRASGFVGRHSARGDLDQLTHLLVTQDGGRLYLNTNAGVSWPRLQPNGRLLWLVKYPRAAVRTRRPRPAEDHSFRDLVPCLAWKDLVIVAPADCDRVFALEAATGQLAWTLPPGAADDMVHLLGVAVTTCCSPAATGCTGSMPTPAAC